MDLKIIEKEINKIWSSLEVALNQSVITISSEKTLVFKFAWSLASNRVLNVTNIDFEKDLFKANFKDGKFLDLYFEIVDKNKVYRVGIEFKFPHKKESNSGGKQIRMKIINDLKKIDNLIQSNSVDLGVFLCATNEDYYLNLDKKVRTENEFATCHGKTYNTESYYPTTAVYSHIIRPSNNIVFNWRNIHLISPTYFSFLNPIFIKTP
ncbi:hypothetical protein FEZ18_06640 [Oceanihabitans sp. IOP_32]|uniref:hypothetical protein n=1 Tax=Oceanihabitans sp. IOP_32 TaxID=2529032 RepID=UPI0012940750|nr:hypothetical protein [Oceanihabitans sp. IOP_32]QFZ54493.1 hypothetical protein FEZ18_06640 [Oceanihabitans sp. IOP_32]